MTSYSYSQTHRDEAESGIPIKSTEEIKLMRETCNRAAIVLEEMAQNVVSGMTTYDLDRFGKSVMEKVGVESACFGYEGTKRAFPSYTCISINNEVVHGVADLNRVIQDGDVVSLDVVVRYNGYVGDNARTVIVGQGTEKNQQLVKTTQEALFKGIEKAVKGNRVGDISFSIQKFVEKAGYSVIREFVGHGVGASMHEEPQIPNYGRKHTGSTIQPGMTLAIEPMVNMGRKDVHILGDGWTVVTSDGLPSAHFEHTILVLTDGVEILTKLN